MNRAVRYLTHPSSRVQHPGRTDGSSQLLSSNRRAWPPWIRHRLSDTTASLLDEMTRTMIPGPQAEGHNWAGRRRTASLSCRPVRHGSPGRRSCRPKGSTGHPHRPLACPSRAADPTPKQSFRGTAHTPITRAPRADWSRSQLPTAGSLLGSIAGTIGDTAAAM